MPFGGLTVTRDLSGLRNLKRDLVPEARRAVRASAERVRADSSSNAPVDTGATRDGHYISIVGERSDYAKAAALAMARRPGVKVVPERRATAITGGREGRGLGYLVGVVTPYAIFLELGAAGRAARAFLIPAFLRDMPKLQNAIVAIIKRHGGV